MKVEYVSEDTLSSKVNQIEFKVLLECNVN
jgi:hypothetical protein